MGDCARCGAPTPGVTLCATCILALRIELQDVAGIIPDCHRGTLPSLPAELDTTFAREDQLTEPYPHARHGGPLPLVFKTHAAEALWVLHSVLAAWAPDLGHIGPESSTVRLAHWFLAHLDAVQRCTRGAELVDEITSAVHQARRAIDRPDDRRIFLGPCGARQHPLTGQQTPMCVTEVYGLPWRDTAVCEGCGTEYRVMQRQEWLRERAQRYLGTAPEVAGFLRVTGVACTAEMIRGYAHRGRLAPAGRNPRGHPLYLISDVLAVIRDRYMRRGR